MVQPQSQCSEDEQLAPVTSKLYAPVSNIDIYAVNALSQADSLVYRNSNSLLAL